jgi:hypothetical protein
MSQKNKKEDKNGNLDIVQTLNDLVLLGAVKSIKVSELMKNYKFIIEKNNINARALQKRIERKKEKLNNQNEIKPVGRPKIISQKFNIAILEKYMTYTVTNLSFPSTNVFWEVIYLINHNTNIDYLIDLFIKYKQIKEKILIFDNEEKTKPKMKEITENTQFGTFTFKIPDFDEQEEQLETPLIEQLRQKKMEKNLQIEQDKKIVKEYEELQIIKSNSSKLRYFKSIGLSYKNLICRKLKQKITKVSIKFLQKYYDVVYSLYKEIQELWIYDETGVYLEKFSKLFWGKKGSNGSYIYYTPDKFGCSSFFAISNKGDCFLYFITNTNCHCMIYSIDNEVVTVDKVKSLTNEIMVDIAKRFIEYIKGKRIILIGDNLKIHTNSQVTYLFQKNNIVMLRTPPYLAYLTSPLDRLFFGYFKRMWYSIAKQKDFKDNDEKNNYIERLVIEITKNTPTNIINQSFHLCMLPLPGINSIKPNFDCNKDISQQIGVHSYIYNSNDFLFIPDIGVDCIIFLKNNINNLTEKNFNESLNSDQKIIYDKLINYHNKFYKISNKEDNLYEDYNPIVEKSDFVPKHETTIFDKINPEKLKLHNEKINLKKLNEDPNFIPINIINGIFEIKEIDKMPKEWIKFLYLQNQIRFSKDSKLEELKKNLKFLLENKNESKINLKTEEIIVQNNEIDNKIEFKKDEINSINKKITNENIKTNFKPIENEIIEIFDDDEIPNIKLEKNILDVNNEKNIIEHNYQIDFIVKSFTVTDIFVSDYNSILKKNWLNSKIMNCYLKEILKIQYMDSYNFYLINSFYNERFERINTKKLFNKYFENEEVIILCNINYHWFFTVFKNNTLFILDSLSKNEDYYYNNMNNFIKFLVYLKINQLEYNKIDIKNLRIQVLDYPQQTDYYNCGIACLIGIEKFIKIDYNLDLVDKNLFDPNKLDENRLEIEKILFYDINIKKRSIDIDSPKQSKKLKTDIKTYNLDWIINYNGEDIEDKVIF